MAFGPFVIYPPVGYIDPWIYTGYFSNFAYLLSAGGLTYYVSRLPWILPGRLVFGIAGAQAGSLLLCAGTVTLGAVSLYWMVRWYYGVAPAALAAIAWCTNPYVMAAAVWQFPDGPAIAYAMAGLALYVRPAGNRGWNSFWAASLLVLSGTTHMAAGPMLLSTLVFPLWRCRHSVKELLKEAVCSGAGAGAAAFVLSRISRSLFGTPHFLQPQIDQTLYVMHTPGYLADMWGTGPGFLLGAVHLFAPVFLLVFGLVLLIAIRKPAAVAWPAYLALWVCLALYAVQEFVLHGAALRVPYSSSYMMVVTMAFAGFALGEVRTRCPGRGRAAVISAGALALGAIALSLAFSNREIPFPDRGTWFRLALLGAVCTGLGVLTRRPKLPVHHLTCAFILAILFLSPALDWHATGHIWSGEKVAHGSNLISNRNAVAFRHVMEVENYVKSHVDTRRDLLFWWDADEPQARFFTSAAALFECGHLDVDKGLRSGGRGLLASYFPTSRTIVHLTVHPEQIAGRTRLMADHGILVANERRTTIEDAGQRFSLVMQDVIDNSRMH